MLAFSNPVAAAEHRSPPRGCRETFDRARGAYYAPGELGERRGGREAEEKVGGSARIIGVRVSYPGFHGRFS